jgi:hypothetical protein
MRPERGACNGRCAGPLRNHVGRPRTGADEQRRKHGRIGRRQDHECRRTRIRTAGQRAARLIERRPCRRAVPHPLPRSGWRAGAGHRGNVRAEVWSLAVVTTQPPVLAVRLTMGGLIVSSSRGVVHADAMNVDLRRPRAGTRGDRQAGLVRRRIGRIVENPLGLEHRRRWLGDVRRRDRNQASVRSATRSRPGPRSPRGRRRR